MVGAISATKPCKTNKNAPIDTSITKTISPAESKKAGL